MPTLENSFDPDNLPWWDRKWLEADAHVRTLSAFVRDDIKDHPARAALYGLYTAAIIAPWPLAVAAIPALPVIAREAIAELPLIGPLLSSGISATADLMIVVARLAIDFGTFGWVRRCSTPWSAKVSECLRLAEVEETICKEYEKFVEPKYIILDLEPRYMAEELQLRHWALLGSTIARTFNDCCASGGAVIGALHDQAKKTFERYQETSPS